MAVAVVAFVIIAVVFRVVIRVPGGGGPFAAARSALVPGERGERLVGVEY